MYVQHNTIIYMRSFSNSCHLLSALSILLSWKIPICFPSNHSKQCGTVLAGGLMQMHLLPRQKNRWLYLFLGMWDMLLCLHGGRIETRCSCPCLNHWNTWRKEEVWDENRCSRYSDIISKTNIAFYGNTPIHHLPPPYYSFPHFLPLQNP